jgi:hypothetical protein
MGFDLRQLPASIGATLGTGAHAGAQFIMDTKIDSDTIPPVSQSIDASIEQFREEIQDGVQFDDSTPNLNEAEKQISRIVSIYSNEVAPRLQPKFTEKKRAAKVADLYQLEGRLDLETVDLCLRDLKTGARTPVCEAQFGGYSLLKKTEDGVSFQTAVMDHIPRKTRGAPWIQHVYDPIKCEKIASEMIQHITGNIDDFLATGNEWAFMANPMSMMCSDRYCPAWGTNFCTMGRVK